MPEHPSTKPARNGRKSRSRRIGHLRTPHRLVSLRSVVTNPAFAPVSIITLVMFLATALTIALAHDRLMLSEGRVSDQTRAVRTEFAVPDPAATQRARDERSLLTPSVYTIDESVRLELESSLRALPAALAAAETLDDVTDEIRAAFGLTAEQLDAIRTHGNADAEAQAWASRVQTLMLSISERPLLSSDEFQRALDDPAPRLELRIGDAEPITVLKSRALNVEGDLEVPMRQLVRGAGFPLTLRDVVVQRLTTSPKPLFVFDRGATEANRAEAAQAVPVQTVSFREGDVLVRQGEVISADLLTLIRREHDSFHASRSKLTVAIRWLGSAGVALTINLALAIYLWLFYPSVVVSPKKLMGLVALIGGGALLGVWATVLRPDSLWSFGLTPIVFASMITIVMFDPRLGLASASAQCAIIGSAIAPPIGFFVAVLVGVGVSSWLLREIRSRSDVVRAAVGVGITLSIASALVSLASRPLVDAIWIEISLDLVRAGGGGFVAGAFTLVVLPSMERFFGVTTGMTLSELRDPKQPLLRELQQRAPGTFNHSHTVATIAEAAAEAIGADGLHVYVGALYHDIGKMNKPDYFVENQSPGFNRHSKLSPAMSLLVIVGHVKDGVELAREYNLARSLVGYIETHHGTTLVSYFYDRAKKKAEAGESDSVPDEIEYRYPGPRPRTREQAILMLCDGVESATRALPEPTPSRIGALVHDLATKRLHDGQFDDSALTLRELRLIEEAVTKALCAIYHGRIAYPKEEVKEASPETKSAMEQSA